MTLLLRVIRVVAACVITASLSAQVSDIVDLQHKAAAGDSEAQFLLAKRYLGEGTGIATDPKLGLELLQKSARSGYSGAQVVLGVLYQNGFSQKGVNLQQDLQEAANWYRKAARQPNNSEKNATNAKHAQDLLSKMLSQGLITKQEADWHMSVPPPAKDHKSPPFSLAEVETGLTGGITTARMATLVNTYGVNFVLSAATQKSLADKGADPTLLAAISSSKR